jgi:hypothetical protein
MIVWAEIEDIFDGLPIQEYKTDNNSDFCQGEQQALTRGRTERPHFSMRKKIESDA